APPALASPTRLASTRPARARSSRGCRTPTGCRRCDQGTGSRTACAACPRARRRRPRPRTSPSESVHDTAMGTYNHPGQVVTNLERSKRFYQEVFGFRFWYEIQPPDEATAKLSSLTPPLGMTASYLTLDGFVLELMHYSAP